MPRSGPVHKVVEPTTQSQQQESQYSPVPPEAGATAQEIVEGFLAAGVGAQDDYAVARQYLTPQLANTWTPEARVLVHPNKPNTEARLEDGQFRTSVEVSAELSPTGVLRQQPEGTSGVLDFALTSVDGQWRISQAPDGVIVPEADFDQIFAPYNLYFFDSSAEQLVPDPRWFAKRSTVSTEVVRALLAGPAPYLEGSLESSFPSGATLARSAVPVTDGTAEVDLTLGGFDPANIELAQRMEQQLRASLRSVPAVESVRLRVNDAPVETSGGSATDPVTEQNVPDRQIAVSDGRLAFYQGGQTEAITDVQMPAGASIIKPAMDREMVTFGWVDPQQGAVYTVRKGQDPVQRWTGQNLTRPSFDRLGYVWGADGNGQVSAARVTGQDAGFSVSASWVADQDIVALRISRDGTRVLLVTSGAQRETSNVWLAGIIRDDSGRPSALNQGNLVAADVDVDTVKWINGTEFVSTTLGQSDNARPMLYSVAGTSEPLPALVGVTSLAGGNGRSSIYGVAGGSLYLLTGSSWVAQSERLSDTAFAG